MRKNVPVARNYAIAFLNIFGDDISVDSFSSLQDLLSFWQHYGRSLSFLTMPGVLFEKKLELLEILLKKIGAPLFFNKLFGLLIQHKRSSLISTVLSQVVYLYKIEKDIEFFTISTAHQLQNDELETIKQFLKREAEKTVLYECHIDKSLIAGIRCQSETLLWEHSVRKQLNDLRRQFILQGTR